MYILQFRKASHVQLTSTDKGQAVGGIEALAGSLWMLTQIDIIYALIFKNYMCVCV